jgi:threonine/homoserine/homoserine lactone efflux protein
VNYLPEFLTIVVAHALAVVSPGPDFALVLRQSLAHGRRAAIWSSVGIGSGLSFHIGYCILGLGYFLKNTPAALATVQYLGAAYLAWVGVQALRTKAVNSDIDVGRGLSPASSDPVGPKARPTGPSDRAAWTTGFVVNVLNPKVALFFVSLFALAVGANTPKLVQVGYGLWMTVATMAWFSFVSVVFTREEIRRRFLHYGHWIDRALGVVFIAFAVSLVIAKLG